MKDILKYLRQLNSLTQEEVARRIGLSRQSYIKYEKGLVQPSSKVVGRLAELYQVPEDFIYRNEVPRLNPGNPSRRAAGGNSGEVVYHIDPDFGLCQVADSGPVAPSAAGSAGSCPPERKEPKTYEGYFDGTAVRVLTDEVFPTGKRFRLVEITGADEDEVQRKRRAWEKIQEIIKDRKPYQKASDDDPFYKEALYEALERKYGPLG